MKKIKIIPVGGRIKSAAVGLDVFLPKNVDNLQHNMRLMRENPPIELLTAFFPSNKERMKQMMRGIGFYRPILKTDQGMAGNFLPFYIDQNLIVTDLSVKRIVKEEGLAIPELYLDHDSKKVEELQKAFRKLDFRETYRILEPMLALSREAEKGRIPFFLIRPALTSSPIIFGRDITDRVTEKVEELLGRVISLARQMASEARHDFSYFLADAFITMDGEVTIEKLHFPDVGFFITELSLDNSIAKEVQGVVNGILSDVFDHVPGLLSSSVIHIITRDEVIARQEDVLEIFEIKSISRRLENLGFGVKIVGASQAGEIPKGAICLILNLIDHGPVLLERFRHGEITCYPSPYLQLASKELTGLKETLISPKFVSKFLELIDCSPKNYVATDDIISRIDGILLRYNITSEFLHVEGKETIPVHRGIHHSWKRMINRVSDADPVLNIREIPLNKRNSLITSTTGPRMHVFRFTFIAE